MPKIKGLRWWMIGLIMLASIVNYLTRATLAVAAPTILHDLHITTRQYSWIVGAFQGPSWRSRFAAGCWTCLACASDSPFSPPRGRW